MNTFTSDKPVAIIGAGVMGSKVAWACARVGLTTRLFDLEQGKAVASLVTIRSWSEGEELSALEHNLSVADTLDDAVANAQLAFENVPENLQLKQKVLAEISAALPEDCYLGSNTSSLTATPLANATVRPEQFFCLNFTDPRTDKLVELMASEHTAPATEQFARDWAAAIRMVPVQVKKEQMGYTFNRLWRVIKKEVLRQINEGYSTPQDIDRAFMLCFGTPIGPCGIMDSASLSTILAVEESYYKDTGDPTDEPPKFLRDMVERGDLGVVSGKGFYEYPDPAFQKSDFLNP